ncbi:MAG: zinc-finger domain-containing protein [Robiginitomaculum sp.]|nr:MAG: zinc-finger domain-containing protein [Robiginitomaculum sp.]
MAPNSQANDETGKLPPHKTLHVETDRVACDGGGGALGHPKVYYDLAESGEAHCFYCCAHFIKK